MSEQKRAVLISRKDTIVIAVLVNTMLLALLFALAYKGQPDTVVFEEPVASRQTSAEVDMPLVQASNTPVDELDQIIQEYAQKASDKEKKAVSPVDQCIVEVRKGDSLAKIAKNYGVKVEDIVTANGLTSQKLRIGQQLRIPKKQLSEAKPATNIGEEYYVIRSGDNPWKLARKFHIKFEDLLKLNNLDEESAKNLKIGDTIRVR